MTEDNNTYIFDPESAAEMARLINQDQSLTRGMGGPFTGIRDMASLHTIVDLACGPGGWALDTAFALPEADVAGVDISSIMIRYADARARSQGIRNVSFGIMDLRQPLDFSDNSVDLINARLLVAVLLRERWPAILRECYRILRPGGTLRLTECDDGGRTTSAAYERISLISSQAMHQAGYGFSPDGQTLGMSAILPTLMRQAGFQNVCSLASPIDFSVGSPAYSDLTQNSRLLYKQAQPLFISMGVTTKEEMDALHFQMNLDMLGDDFAATWTLWTSLATKPL